MRSLLLLSMPSAERIARTRAQPRMTDRLFFLTHDDRTPGASNSM